MGNRRMGLGRMEKLLEAVDRDLDLTNSTLTNCTITTSADATFTGGATIGAANALKLTSATATSATVAVTKDTNYAVPAISQPAGTIIKDVICIPAGNIVTAGNSGDDLDLSIGTSAAGEQIAGLKAILDDGGSALTWAANYPLYIFQNGSGRGANAHAGSGIATSEATVWASTPYSAGARDIHINFRANTDNLATAATTIKVVVVFQYV